VVHTRGQQTGGVWGQFAPTFKVGALTLTQHLTDVGAILTAANTFGLAVDALDDARAARKAKRLFLSDLGVRVPRAIEGQLADGDDLHDELSDVRKVDGEGEADVLERCRRLASVWTRYNAQRAAATPPLAALTVKAADGSNTDVTLAMLQAAITAHPMLLQAVEDRKSDVSKARSALKKAVRLADRNNKRWLSAWEGEFPEGSAELDALSQIDTGPSIPAPTALEIATVTPQAGGAFAVSYAAGGGAHATTLLLQWQIVGVDAAFGHDALLVLAGQTVATGASAGAIVKFRTVAENSQGTTPSTEQTGTAQ
jgi:hypothetical protein